MMTDSVHEDIALAFSKSDDDNGNGNCMITVTAKRPKLGDNGNGQEELMCWGLYKFPLSYKSGRPLIL